MKILHFIYDDINNPWYGGGASLRTHEIYKRLANKHDITVITGNYPEVEQESMVDGIKYKRLGSGENVIRSILTYSWGVFCYRKNPKVDIVIKDLIPYAPTFTPLVRRVPSIASIQMANYPFFKSGGALGIIPFFIEGLSFKLHQNYIVPSMGMKQIVAKKVNKINKMAIIPYGVHDYLFDSSDSQEADYILYLGRFDIYHKGLDILLEAFKKVLKAKPDIRLILAGGGRETGRLKTMIGQYAFGDRVEIVGRVSDLRKKELIEQSLFMVIPSRFESWGIVALEAGACNKAVIGTEIKCLSEAIRKDETGVLVPPENPVALAQAIIYMSDDVEKRKMMGEAGKNWARKFSWDNLASQQEKFYEEVINAN